MRRTVKQTVSKRQEASKQAEAEKPRAGQCSASVFWALQLRPRSSRCRMMLHAPMRSHDDDNDNDDDDNDERTNDGCKDA